MRHNHTRVNRRQFIGASAGTVAATFAGCLGSDSDSTEFVTAFAGGRQPTQVHFNPWNASDYAQTYSIYWLQGTVVTHADGTVSTDFFEDLSVDGREVTLEFSDEWSYWNGNDITAEDYLIEQEIWRYQDPEASPIEGHELVDEYTVKRIYKDDISPTIAKSNAGAGTSAPKSVFREYYERYEDATTESEREAVTDDLLQLTIDTEEFVEEGYGSSLFKIEDFNSSETLATKWDDHPWADRTDIEQIRVKPTEGTQVEQLEKSDELDMTQYITEDQRSDYPDNIENIYELDHYSCRKYILNWNNEHLARRPVRRAIISAIDIPSIVDAANQTGLMATPTQVQTGIRASIEEKYLGEDFVDSLIDYPVEADEETAVEYMEEAGYSREGGEWIGPDGNATDFTAITQAGVRKSQPMKVFTDHLNEFGFNVEMEAVGQDYYSRVQEWEFDIAWMWHVALPYWHPVAYFSNDFYGLLAGDVTSDSDTGPTGVPFSLEIPEEVGATEVGGNGVEINPAQLMVDLEGASSEEETIELTRTLAQWVNYDLPVIVHLQENRGFAGDVENFDFPSEDDFRMDRSNPGPNALLNGHITTN
ncbi:extracellular solute-binding protein family 5 (plasmid) [Haloterrigena turkmenica DSM 5511]|uniref:Extracellular solute-binding protein family 5 n=1 Tax=Haloterrigena turkmenica (strain ATCC 51198 / DSM 5511 / JCM 9101 / NCIMB 13204 / VKM B-1734 / 4k) TaxID=543526 RepID=D2S049_HALTV|nr:ABC transporter substrate-binding protein [Haloterrigena turkmenica]ADB62746.1 extracellular solute-binding protein family 5 [Haloterrigena turkmenica DSM 5511]